MGAIMLPRLKQFTRLVFFILILNISSCYGEETSTTPPSARDPRIIVLPYPSTPVRVPEPYSYPGPSPPVMAPPRSPETYSDSNPPSRSPEPYGYQSHSPPPRTPVVYGSYLGSGNPPRAPDSYPTHLSPAANRPQMPEAQHVPKWCKSMWEREECGMRCWMLRKICRNMYKQILADNNKIEENKADAEMSPSAAYPYLKPFSPYYFRKLQPGIMYSKTGLPNTYYAQPTWPSSPYSYPYYKKSPYYTYKYSSHLSNDFGLNPQFTYVEGYEKLPIQSTTMKTQIDEDEETTTTTETPKTTTTTTTTTEEPAKSDPTTVKPIRKKAKPNKFKGAYPVKVTYNYPKDTEVATLSPLMFEYDQYSNRGYYGDRIYMSAVLPVADRQYRSVDTDDYDSFDDFDEMMIDP